MALGDRVRALRKRKGYSQEAFADAAKLHRTWMGAVERGESNLSFHNLVRISEALGITLAQLVSGLERKTAVLAKNRSEEPAALRGAGRRLSPKRK